MKTKLVIIILMFLFLAGCKTMQQQYASALVGITTTKDELIMLRESAVFNDEEWEEIYPWFPASTKFLEAMGSAYENNQKELFRTYYDATMQALFELQTRKRKAKGQIIVPKVNLKILK